MTKNDNSYTHILKYIGLFGGVQGLSVALSVVRGKCAAMLIGAAGIGILDLFNRSVDFFSSTLNLGLPVSAIKHISAARAEGMDETLCHEVATLRMWSQWTSAAGFVITLLFAPVISFFAFGNFSHVVSFLLLAPLVSTGILMASELALLKGLQRLRAIAAVTTVTILITTATTILFYFLWGMKGILPSLYVCTGTQCLLTMRETGKSYPFRIILFSRSYYHRGLKMIRLGMAFTLAAMAGTGAEMLLRVLIQRTGSLSDVGLYVAGFTLCVAYAKVVFVAMDADYYPRLSAAIENPKERNAIINKQIDVCVSLMSPFLILFMALSPIIVRLIYVPSFGIVAPMCIAASLYMFFKAIITPIAYLPLAHGDSLMYFIMEAIYDVAFVPLVMGGYIYGGFLGAGCALSLANLLDLALIGFVYWKRYRYLPARRTTLLSVSLLALNLSGLVVSLSFSGGGKYGISALLTILSLVLSARLIGKNPLSLLRRRR